MRNLEGFPRFLASHEIHDDLQGLSLSFKNRRKTLMFSMIFSNKGTGGMESGFSRLYLLGCKKARKFNQTKLQTSWSLLCQVLSFRNRLRPGLWSTMANEENFCGFWVHILFAVCGNAVALLNTFLHQGRKNIKLSEGESSARTPLGPDFSFGVCPSSSSTSYDSEPVKKH